MSATLTASLADSWLARQAQAYRTLLAAEKAPALFKTEYVAEVQREAEHAERQYRYWLGQDVSR